MSKGLLRLGMVPGVGFFFLFAGIAGGGHIKDHAVQYVLEGTREWEASRGCGVSAEGANLLARRFTALSDVLETKSLKYKLTQAEDVSAVRGMVIAYLDHASLETFGPHRKGCYVDAAVVRKVGLPPILANPDTGILDINGSHIGADIFIDGVKKGNIRQAFVLSVGGHTWKSMKCEERVEIRANETLNRYCDKK